MTKTAAELLYEMFSSWMSSGEFPINTRDQILGDRIKETWQASLYLKEIEALLEADGSFPEDHPLQAAIPKFWKWIYASGSMDNTRNSNYVDERDIALLYDFRYNPVNQVGKPVVSALHQVIEGLPALIEEVDADPDLNNELKRYVKTILHHAYKVLSVDSHASEFEQEKALSELAIALGLAVHATKDEEKAKKWRDIGSQVVSHLAAGFFGAAGGSAWAFALQAGEAVQQITGS